MIDLLINIDDITYSINLSGAGVPILLLHGFTGSGANWQPIAEKLAKHYQVITVDLLGHGQTSSPADPTRYQMEAAARDLSAILDQVTQQPAHLIGYSMGGRLALYLALHYPQQGRSLILESASPGLADPGERAVRRKSDDQMADRIEKIGIPAFIEEWENLPLFATQNQDAREKLRQQRLQNNPAGLANSLRGMGTGVQPSLWDRLPELTMPTLLLAGELDPKFIRIAYQMQTQISKSQLALVPAAGHTIHVEQPAAYLRLVSDYLNLLAHKG